MTEKSTITVTKGGGQTFAGPEAVDYFRAATTLQALKLFKQGITPGRGVNKTTVLEIAGKYTGIKYRRGQWDFAIAGMTEYLEKEKSRWVPAEAEAAIEGA